MVNISIYFVDGSMSEYEENDLFILQLRKLQNNGFQGKSLINTLISDDWGAPPSSVILKGKLNDGSEINESIRYE
ncbi:MAG: hypothetical protein ACYDD5_13180 [Sulfuricurvum sp.]|nr:MAG: hypothetical protein B7Y17_02385 [Sulfuricurvum sp. 24-42-5]